MSRKRFYWLFLLACFCSAGCLSFEPKPDPSRFFALTSLPRSQKALPDAGTGALSLGIGPVSLPGYLDRAQLVTRISQNRFAIAENDRWAEALEDNFSRVLAQNLATLLQTDRTLTYPWERSQQPTYQVQVDVLRFEPNAEGVVELLARWRIIDGARKTLSARESHVTQAAKDKSTEASVASMSEAVGELSKEIAAAIRALPAVSTR